MRILFCHTLPYFFITRAKYLQHVLCVIVTQTIDMFLQHKLIDLFIKKIL